LNERPAPASLAADVEALLGLSPQAKGRLLEILLPCLAPTLGPEVDQKVEAFARQTEVVPSRLVFALRGLRFLLETVARAAAEKHVLSVDLGRLGGERAEELRALVLPLYEPATKVLRAEMVRRTILDHGALLTGVDWRVDRVLGSQHGHALGATLGVLTLSYRHGSQEERLTLHCEPAVLQNLRTILDAMLE
jgi:hypothetical protein